MTYDQLVAFLAVAGEGSFTGASMRLGKSQPAVSKLVRNLEGELGVELFDRSAYRATLTDTGRLFHDRAAAVIEDVEALRTFGVGLAGTLEPVVRLAVEAVTPLAPIMAVLRTLQARYPSVRIELSSERLAGAAEALREQRADVVVATRIGLESLKVDAVPFRTVRILPVVRADHPLARHDGRVPASALRAHPQIVLRDTASGQTAPSFNVVEGGLRWNVDDVGAKLEVILAGMGWGGLPEHVVAGARASGDLVVLDVPGFEATMALFALRRRDRAHGVVATALWDELAATAAARSPSSAPPAPRSGRPRARRARADASSPSPGAAPRSPARPTTRRPPGRGTAR
jgi:DNA-binding transcriptional LysR family regulator